MNEDKARVSGYKKPGRANGKSSARKQSSDSEHTSHSESESSSTSQDEDILTLCAPLDWQDAELPSSVSDAVLCSVLVRKMWDI